MNSIAYKSHHNPLELVNVNLPERNVHNVVTRIADIVETWSQRGRQRRQLANLEEHLLSDIGVSYEDIWLETNKPFWKE